MADETSAAFDMDDKERADYEAGLAEQMTDTELLVSRFGAAMLVLEGGGERPTHDELREALGRARKLLLSLDDDEGAWVAEVFILRDPRDPGLELETVRALADSA